MSARQNIIYWLKEQQALIEKLDALRCQSKLDPRSTAGE